MQQIGFIALWYAFSLTNCPLFSGAPTYSAAPAPASEFFGIDQSITYGTSTSILTNTAGVVDTGTTLTLISTGASIV